MLDSPCWICGEENLPGDRNQPRIAHPLSGQWAHEYCVRHTTAGAWWRLRISVQDLLEAMWRSVRR